MRPSFLHGLARTLDIWGSLNPDPHLEGPEADLRAMQEDWTAVGHDLADAMRSLDAELLRES
jgi:hypothetical protein